jgi:hypothetical protein
MSGYDPCRTSAAYATRRIVSIPSFQSAHT